MSGRWLVRSRDGYCATKHNRKFRENATSVATVCGCFIVLPGGIDRGEPDCPDCIAALHANRANIDRAREG